MGSAADQSAPLLVSPSPSDGIPGSCSDAASAICYRSQHAVATSAVAIPTGATNRASHGMFIHRHQDLLREGIGPIGGYAGYGREDGSRLGGEESNPHLMPCQVHLAFTPHRPRSYLHAI
jgi:hypothetical protein